MQQGCLRHEGGIRYLGLHGIPPNEGRCRSCHCVPQESSCQREHRLKDGFEEIILCLIVRGGGDSAGWNVAVR